MRKEGKSVSFPRKNDVHASGYMKNNCKEELLLNKRGRLDLFPSFVTSSLVMFKAFLPFSVRSSFKTVWNQTPFLSLLSLEERKR
jgi:hypothetical protein